MGIEIRIHSSSTYNSEVRVYKKIHLLVRSKALANAKFVALQELITPSIVCCAKFNLSCFISLFSFLAFSYVFLGS